MQGSGGTVSPGSITAGPAGNLHRGGNQASFRSTVSDTEVETLQVITVYLKNNSCKIMVIVPLQIMLTLN